MTETTIPPEFCSKCFTKLSTQRVYVDDKIICPACYTGEILKNQGSIWKSWECFRCKKINAPFVKSCDCQVTTTMTDKSE